MSDLERARARVQRDGGWENVAYLRAAELNHLKSAVKQWRNATESRLKLLDSRGEAAKAMLKADKDLIAALEEL